MLFKIWSFILNQINIKREMIHIGFKATLYYALVLCIIFFLFFNLEIVNVGHMTVLRLIRSMVFTFVSISLTQVVLDIPFNFKQIRINKKIILSMAVTIVWLVLYTIVFAQTKNILNGDIGNYYLLPSLLFCSSVLILEIFSRIKFKFIGVFSFSVLAFLLLSSALFFAIYYFLYDQQFDEYALLCVIATNPEEIINFLTSSFTLEQIICILLLSTLLLFLLIYSTELSVKYKPCSVVFNKYTISCYLLIFGYCGYYLCTVFPLDQFIHLHRKAGPMRAFIELQQNIEKNANAIRIKHDNNTLLLQNNKGSIVLVIGESACRDRMSAFNSAYPYNTTPWEKSMVGQSDFVFVNKAYSNFSNTVMAVTQALTSSNQYNGLALKDAVDIFSLAKRVGYKTYWISTQGKSTVSDAGITIIANQADKTLWLGGYDEVILKELRKIPKNDKNFIVIQLMGSHFNYNRRVPKKYLLENNFPETGKGDKVKWYEYSLHYTDDVLKQMFLYARDEMNLQAMIYVSDHGEDMKYTHTASPFRFNMVRIPLWIYLSPRFQCLHPEILNNLQKNKEMIFTNDLIFELMSGIIGAKTDSYENIYDLGSSEYGISEDKALTMHGKKLIKEDNREQF